jgi:hypothetical protein
MLKSALFAVSSDQDALLPLPRTEEAKVQTISAIQAPPTIAAGATATTAHTDGGKRDLADAGTSTNNLAPPISEATAEISSDPPGADIEIDGSFVGSTPSSVGIATGEHTVRVSKNGYKPWQRTLRSSTGNIKIAAALEPTAITSAGSAHVAAQQLDADSSTGNPPSPTGTALQKADGPSVTAAPATHVLETAASSPAGPPEESLMGVSFTGNPTVRHDGVEISGVQPKGPANSIDIKSGDVILAINAHYLFTIEEVRSELLQYKPGARVLIRYRRNQFISENYVSLRVANP